MKETNMSEAERVIETDGHLWAEGQWYRGVGQFVDEWFRIALVVVRDGSPSILALRFSCHGVLLDTWNFGPGDRCPGLAGPAPPPLWSIPLRLVKRPEKTDGQIVADVMGAVYYPVKAPLAFEAFHDEAGRLFGIPTQAVANLAAALRAKGGA